MKLWARQLAFGLLLTAAIPSAAAQAADSVEQTLLQKANFWRLKARPDLVRQSLDKLLKLNPNQADALYLYGVLELQQGDLIGARTYLSRLRDAAPGDARIAELEAGVGAAGTAKPIAVAQAGALLPAKAEHRLAAPAAVRDRNEPGLLRAQFQNALSADPGNPWVRLDFARFLAKQGAAAQGFATVDPAASGNTPAGFEAAAIYDSEQGRMADALAKLDRIPPDRRTAEMDRMRSNLAFAGTLQRVQRLAGAGKIADARELLVALSADPVLRPRDRAEIPRVLAALADPRAALRVVEIAKAAGRQTIDGGAAACSGSSTPPQGDPAAVAASAGGSESTQADPTAPVAAPLEMTARSADSPDLVSANGANSPKRLQLASLASDPASDSNGTSDRTVPPAPAPIVPGAPPAADAAIKPPEQLAQLELTIPQPIGGYEPPIENGPVPEQDSLELDIERSMAQIEQETSPVLEAGLVYRGRAGQSGLSALNEVAAPVEGQFSPFLTGTLDITVSPIYLDAGTAGPDALPFFGANPILTAGGAPVIAAGAQNTSGVLTALGYTFGPFSARIGDVAWGFPVNNIIGNAAYQPKFFNDTLSFRIEALRQPVTDSLLSYAGTHASLGAANAATGGAFGTDGTWGGVVKSGGRVSAFYDDSDIGAFGTVGYSALTGKNVTENDEIEAVVGTYFRPYRGDNDALRVGVNLTYFGFNKNLSFYTFGQGGYFSPQNYEAITFPVEYQGRTGRWSYLGAVALGVQHFNQDESPYFPNDPAAQAALVGLVGPGGAVYPSHTTTGLAADIRAQVEYEVASDLAVGVAGSFDNGHSYNEGVIKLYVRKTFDDPPRVTAILPGTPMARP